MSSTIFGIKYGILPREYPGSVRSTVWHNSKKGERFSARLEKYGKPNLISIRHWWQRISSKQDGRGRCCARCLIQIKWWVPDRATNRFLCKCGCSSEVSWLWRSRQSNEGERVPWRCRASTEWKSSIFRRRLSNHARFRTSFDDIKGLPDRFFVVYNWSWYGLERKHWLVPFRFFWK